MTTMQYSKESMNYGYKLEPTDKNVSRLFCFRSESEILPLLENIFQVGRKSYDFRKKRIGIFLIYNNPFSENASML